MFLLTCIFPLVYVQLICAQSISRVQINGIPSVAKTPYLSSMQKNFEAGRYTVQFIYSSSSQQAKGFRFKITLSRDGDAILDLSSNVKQFTPGVYSFTSFFNDISFPKSVADVLSGIDNKLKKQVLQEGTIPEGTYQLRIEAVPAKQTIGLSVIPGIATFTVRLPSPPTLLTPTDRSDITQNIPTFAWTSITTGLPGTLIYRLRVVEVMEGQTPLQAINGNRPVAEHELNNQTTYSYTPDNLPLEVGNTYAWQVTVQDPVRELPFKNGGKSEIRTFTVKESQKKNNIMLTLEGDGMIRLSPGKEAFVRFMAEPSTAFSKVYLEGFRQRLKPGQDQDSLIKDWRHHFNERLKNARNGSEYQIQRFKQAISNPASGIAGLNFTLEKKERLVTAFRLVGIPKHSKQTITSETIGIAATQNKGNRELSGKIIKAPKIIMIGPRNNRLIKTPMITMTGSNNVRILQAPTLSMTGASSGKLVQTPTLRMTGLGGGKIVQAPTLNMTGMGNGKVIQAPTLTMTGLGSGKIVQAPTLNMTGLGSGKVVQAPTLNMTGLGSGKIVQASTLNMTGLGSGKVVQAPTLNMTGLGTGKVVQAPTLNMTGMGSGKVIQAPTLNMTGIGNINQ